MEIALFGSTGKIGQRLVSYIRRMDPSIKIHAIGHRKDNLFEMCENVAYYSCSITDKSSLLSLPRKVDAVINMAAAVTTRVESSDVRTYIDTNICGALNVLDYAVDACADRIIYPQTYNDVFGSPDIKDAIIHPDSSRKKEYAGESALYAITKNCAVDLQNYYHGRYGLKSFVLRLPTVYCYTKSPYYMVAGQQRIRPFRKMILQAMSGEQIEVWGNPERVMDMVYVEDCCQMFYRSLVADIQGGIFNVGTGVGTSLLDQVKGIIDVFSVGARRSKIVFCPEKPSGPSYVMDIENAKKELDYTPRYMYKDMLREFKRLMQQENG